MRIFVCLLLALMFGQWLCAQAQPYTDSLAMYTPDGGLFKVKLKAKGDTWHIFWQEQDHKGFMVGPSSLPRTDTVGKLRPRLLGLWQVPECPVYLFMVATGETEPYMLTYWYVDVIGRFCHKDSFPSPRNGTPFKFADLYFPPVALDWRKVDNAFRLKEILQPFEEERSKVKPAPAFGLAGLLPRGIITNISALVQAGNRTQDLVVSYDSSFESSIITSYAHLFWPKAYGPMKATLFVACSAQHLPALYHWLGDSGLPSLRLWSPRMQALSQPEPHWTAVAPGYYPSGWPDSLFTQELKFWAEWLKPRPEYRLEVQDLSYFPEYSESSQRRTRNERSANVAATLRKYGAAQQQVIVLDNDPDAPSVEVANDYKVYRVTFRLLKN